MTRASYPDPDRSNVQTDGDLGARTGEFADGRPYRVEAWFTEGITLITCFFSVEDLESASPDDLLAYVQPLLDTHAVPAERQRLSASDVRTINDANGHRMYSLSFVIGTPD